MTSVSVEVLIEVSNQLTDDFLFASIYHITGVSALQPPLDCVKLLCDFQWPAELF